MSEGTKTPFRRELQASVPLELTDVLGFYRRELGKLNWKEEPKGTTIGADSAAVAFTAPEGPAVLRLGRKDGATTVRLMLKDPAAVAKAGIMPKPGQAKVLFGNINPAAETITFNNKPVSVAAVARSGGRELFPLGGDEPAQGLDVIRKRGGIERHAQNRTSERGSQHLQPGG